MLNNKNLKSEYIIWLRIPTCIFTHWFICSFLSLAGELSNHPCHCVKYDYQKNPGYNLEIHSTLPKVCLFITYKMPSSQVKKQEKIRVTTSWEACNFQWGCKKKKGKLFLNIFGSQLIQALPLAFTEAKHFCAQNRGELVLNIQINLVL